MIRAPERPFCPRLSGGLLMIRAGAGAPSVVLRHPVLADRDEFLALVRESRKMHRGWTTTPSDAGKFGEFLRRSKRPTAEVLLACDRASGAIAGVFDLSQIFLGNLRSAYVGYYGHVAYARRGYMTEAMTLVLRRAF